MLSDISMFYVNTAQKSREGSDNRVNARKCVKEARTKITGRRKTNATFLLLLKDVFKSKTLD